MGQTCSSQPDASEPPQGQLRGESKRRTTRRMKTVAPVDVDSESCSSTSGDEGEVDVSHTNASEEVDQKPTPALHESGADPRPAVQGAAPSKNPLAVQPASRSHSKEEGVSMLLDVFSDTAPSSTNSKSEVDDSEWSFDSSSDNDSSTHTQTGLLSLLEAQRNTNLTLSGLVTKSGESSAVPSQATSANSGISRNAALSRLDSGLMSLEKLIHESNRGGGGMKVGGATQKPGPADGGESSFVGRPSSFTSAKVSCVADSRKRL